MQLVDSLMMAFYKKELKSIIQNLCKEYPDRTNVLREAFKAHSRKMYYSSTILFLSQADGLCNGELFKIAKNKKKLKELLEKKSFPESTFIFSEILTEITTIDNYYPNIKKILI